jgi:hypothetical protein
LLGFSDLKRLTIIMPSASIVSILPLWMLELGQTLQHFSLICKARHLLCGIEAALTHDYLLELASFVGSITVAMLSKPLHPLKSAPDRLHQDNAPWNSFHFENDFHNIIGTRRAIATICQPLFKIQFAGVLTSPHMVGNLFAY